MQTPASIRQHPIHPMLIVFPIGLWIFSFVCDLIFLSTRNPVWVDVAYYTMAGGIVGALLAAVPGFIDYLSIRNREVSRIATTHMVLNLIAVALFAVNLWLRTGVPAGTPPPVWLSLIGLADLSVSGWLGGSLVYKHRVAVVTEDIEEPARTAPRRAA